MTDQKNYEIIQNAIDNSLENLDLSGKNINEIPPEIMEKTEVSSPRPIIMK